MASPDSSSVPMPPMPVFDNTIGALLLGGLFSMALWGIAVLQGYNYFVSPRRRTDRPAFKSMTGFLLFLDTLDTAFICHFLYFYIVKNFLNPLGLQILVWSASLHVAMTAISNFLIRSMFTQRIFRLSGGNRVASAWVIAISLLDLLSGLVITVKSIRLGSFTAVSTLSTWFYMSFAAGTAADLSVTLALCYLFYRSKTGLARTDTLLTRLTVYTVNTGFWVAVDASAGMLCFIFMSDNMIFFGFYLLLSKLYLNAFLASIAARDRMRDQFDEPISLQVPSERFALGSSVYDGEALESSPTVLDSKRSYEGSKGRSVDLEALQSSSKPKPVETR